VSFSGRPRNVDRFCAAEIGVKENPRNRKRPKRGRKRWFNAAIHALRMRVERTFAWEDKFKRLLLRFERIQQRHYGMKLLAYTLINLRAFCGV
jgi:transposase